MASYHTTPAKPPKQVTPALATLRAEWYAGNPAQPDWNANAVQQRAAFLTLRERQTNK